MAVLSSCNCSIHAISTSTQSMATHGPTVFPTLAVATCPLSDYRRQQSSQTVILANCDPRRQQSSQTDILAGSDPCPLSCYHPFAVTFALLEIHTVLALSTLYGPCTLSSFKFTQQSTSLPSCLLGINICRVILFEWVILFKNPTVIVLVFDRYM